jgi:dTDP-4-dehydrorhamnose reductase
MSKKILILGKGFIGRRLEEGLRCPVCVTKIRAYQDITGIIQKYRPKILVNCVGYTGERNVDDCESSPDKTFEANVFVPVLLAEAALRHNIKLVHISTGCIFHYDYAKQRPIKEDRGPDYYQLFYSRTKIYAENVLRESALRQNILIVRVRVPLDDKPSPRNILTKLLGFKYVIDQPNSITYIPDFIAAVKHLIKIDAKGVYNIVNKGGLRFSQLLNVYQKYHPEFHYETVRPKTLKQNRTNLILSTTKLEQSGFTVRPVKEVLEECVREYQKY